MVSGCYPFLYREDEADFFKKAEAYKRDHSAGTFLKTITLCCVAPCMADEKKIRLIAYFDRDITKADDIIDAWRVLDDVRLLINRIYENRPNIKPSYEEKVKVTALQIYGWLPKSNCRACGEATCLAFAVKLLRESSSFRIVLPCRRSRNSLKTVRSCRRWQKRWEWLKRGAAS
jgi:ArsR family metal-binding transcriptional regulator